MSRERDMTYPPDGSPAPPYPLGQPATRRPARPPLTTRMRPWHWMATDFVVGVLAGVSCVLGSEHAVATVPYRVLLAVVVTLPVGLRRRYPVPAYCALVILAGLATAAGAAEPGGPPFILIVAAYVLYTVTVCGSRRAGVAALALPIAGVIVAEVLAHAGEIPANRVQDIGGAVFVLVLAWMTGYSVRQRRLYTQSMQHEAASNAVAVERLRIARELHDVVAHSMSVIAVQAGYGQYVIDTSPDGARAALGAIQATSREALEDMRRMLGVLRQQEQQDAAPGPRRRSSAPLAPAPGLGDLSRLIQRTRGAGVAVSLEQSGLVRAAPAGTDLSGYRIIQEALTNVVKHAGVGARCLVRLEYGETVLRVRVTDDGGRPLVPAGRVPAAGSGHGLVGMRERAHLCGGEFTAGPLAGGGFQVAVTLPLPGGPAVGTPGGAP